MRPPPDRIALEFRDAWRRHRRNPALFWLITDGRVAEYALTEAEQAALFKKYPPPERPPGPEPSPDGFMQAFGTPRGTEG